MIKTKKNAIRNLIYTPTGIQEEPERQSSKQAEEIARKTINHRRVDDSKLDNWK